MKSDHTSTSKASLSSLLQTPAPLVEVAHPVSHSSSSALRPWLGLVNAVGDAQLELPVGVNAVVARGATAFVEGLAELRLLQIRRVAELRAAVGVAACGAGAFAPLEEVAHLPQSREDHKKTLENSLKRLRWPRLQEACSHGVL